MSELPVLIEVDELADQLSGSSPPHVLDVRWKLGDPHGRRHYLQGHVPGAVYVDLDTELAGHGEPTEGRHPLPTEADFQASARRWGIRAGAPVVVYDDVGGMSAARAWWLLRHGGVTDVRILDGGLAVWRASGRALHTGQIQPDPGDVIIEFGQMAVATDDDAADAGRHRVLVDVRAPERYRGEVEPMDPRAGHIPGATNLPTTGNLDDEGRFLAPEAIRERLAQAVDGADDPENRVVAYCGSGVTATHTIAALASAGIDAALYPGSWSAWSHQDRPVATGPEPGP